MDLSSDEVDGRTIVGRDPGREAAGDQLVVSRAAIALAVVVRAGTAGQQAKAIVKRRERAE